LKEGGLSGDIHAKTSQTRSFTVSFKEKTLCTGLL
jgi:hypothetical protein